MPTIRGNKIGETKILCDKCGAEMSWWTVSGLCPKCRKDQK